MPTNFLMICPNKAKPAFTPNIPYRSKLTERIEPGQTLIIRGRTSEEAKRFNINLHKDSPDFSGNDVPLHVSVRFDEGKLVFNSYTKGAWGKEERQKNPVKKGDAFDIRIRAHDNKFTVSINRREVKSFEHRIPLQHVTHLSIDGDVVLNHVQWGGKYYVSFLNPSLTLPLHVTHLSIDGDVVLNHVQWGGKYYVSFLNPSLTLPLLFDANSFSQFPMNGFNVNLLKKNGDIALHFNPRFDEKAKGFICGKIKPGCVIRNSFVNGEWGNEEREGKNPFEKGVGFDLEIKNEEYAYQIFVNGERFASYAHRIDPHEVGGLQIQGDVELSGIQIVGN
ncbi:unnamed protein product [Haemonchus placei]|uniref:Galectin n=1 Tax=Haemonchus placei TaxID=6290 RepID=A0A158QQ26_HAEPC|nr:unnamed protein product [Haemonchus placei]